MTLLAPYWLLLLIPFIALLYSRRPISGTLLTLRAILLVMIILAMARPALRLPGRGGTLVVVTDRSASMRSSDLNNQREIISLLEKSRPPEARLGVVAFARDAIVEHPPQQSGFNGFVSDPGKYQSNLAAALEKSLSIIPRKSSGKILLLSDARWTGANPAQAAAKAAARNIAIDYRLQAAPLSHDLAIDRVAAPRVLNPGEAFMLTAWIQSPVAQTVSYRLSRSGHTIASGKRSLVTGLNRLVFRDIAPPSGTISYLLQVAGTQQDPRPENNHARILIGVQAQKPLLVLSGTHRHAFSALLRKSGINLRTISPDTARWNIDTLSGYSGLIIENANANRIGRVGMQNIAAWIESTGTGLMMTGGRNSYGPGGYFRSPLEPLLPVSMELKKEDRRFNIAIAVVMDRSGSMGCPAGHGKTKMDLANLGAVQVLDLLQPKDEIGVIAVDSTAHKIVPLGSVSYNAGQRAKILKIDSMGGGIFIYEALKAATRMLLKAHAETRHIILFADAADSEEEGKYTELLKKCAAANITCSVVGLGTEDDCDAALLRDIARLGDGQCFFSDDAMEIPRLFAQDTFSVVRSAMVDTPTKIKFTVGYTLISGTPLKDAPTIGGYNLCYIRPEANLAAITTDENKAPVVASWQVGSGRALCYTGEADGQFTGKIAAWSRYGSFLADLARWTAGESGNLPPDMMLTQTINNGIVTITLHLDPARKGQPFSGAPSISLLHGIPGRKPLRDKLPMHWISADEMSATFRLYGDETALATVNIGGQKPVTLPPVCLPYSPEFRPPLPGQGLATMRELARITGGSSAADVSTVWQNLKRHFRYVEIAPLLYTLAIIILLLEILQRRSGILSNRQLRLTRAPSPGQTPGTTASHGDALQPLTATVVVPLRERQSPNQQNRPRTKHQEPGTKDQEPGTTLSALKQARRRAKNRTDKQ